MKPIYLECDHCGQEAVEALDGYWHEDMTARCMSCGIPGRVSIDEDNNLAEFLVECEDLDSYHVKRAAGAQTTGRTTTKINDITK